MLHIFIELKLYAQPAFAIKDAAESPAKPLPVKITFFDKFSFPEND
jgi:hypothetical protein